MAEHLRYDGQTLFWHADGAGPPMGFKATSGMRGNQRAARQCAPNAGPIPEGRYFLRLQVDSKVFARDDGTDRCNLRPGSLIQKIPRGGDPSKPPSGGAGNECEPFWSNWGQNRVRVEPADAATRNRCSPRRGGFYLHDSTKGYTHGCVEVEPRFFGELYEYVKNTRKNQLTLVVEYAYATTYGGTLRP